MSDISKDGRELTLKQLRGEVIAAHNREEFILVTIDGRESMIKGMHLGKEKIRNMTFEDFKRVAVY